MVWEIYSCDKTYMCISRLCYNRGLMINVCFLIGGLFMGGCFSRQVTSPYDVYNSRPYFYNPIIKLYCEFMVRPLMAGRTNINNPQSTIHEGWYLKSALIRDDNGILFEVTSYHPSTNQILDYPMWINREGIQDNVNRRASIIFSRPDISFRVSESFKYGYGSNQWRDVLFYRISEAEASRMDAEESDLGIMSTWRRSINERRGDYTRSTRSIGSSTGSLSSDNLDPTIVDRIYTLAEDTGFGILPEDLDPFN